MPVKHIATDPMFYKKVLEEMYDGVFIVDINRNILFWNKGAERITGYNVAEVLGLNCTDELLMHLDGSGKRICEKESCPAMDAMHTGKTKEFPAYLQHKEGHRVSVSIKISCIKYGNGPATGAVVVFSDNTKLDRSIRKIEKLEDQAFSDPLTGVRNRRYADIYISMKLKEMKSFELPPLGALFIDIDHFKIFNDNYGHLMGDKVLVMVARTLRNIMREDDMVCRWGGEEFLVAVHGSNFASLKNMAERIRLIVEASPLYHESKSLTVAVSVGGALAVPEDTVKTLIHRADEMMYKSKQAGRNRVTVKGITFPPSG